MKITKADLRLAEIAAAKENSRYTINGLLVDKSGVAVTDGCIAIRVDRPAMKGDSDAGDGESVEPFVLRSEDAKRAMKIAPRGRYGSLEVTGGGHVRKFSEKLSAAAGADSGAFVITSIDPADRFPDIERVLKPPDEQDQPLLAQVAFNAKLLKQLCEAVIAQSDRKDCRVELDIYENYAAGTEGMPGKPLHHAKEGLESPVYFRSQALLGGTLRGAIMPLMPARVNPNADTDEGDK